MSTDNKLDQRQNKLLFGRPADALSATSSIKRFEHSPAKRLKACGNIKYRECRPIRVCHEMSSNDQNKARHYNRMVNQKGTCPKMSRSSLKNESRYHVINVR
jgi:hypothetical protein